MAIVNGIVTIIKAIINGIVALFMGLVSCLTCGKARKRHDKCGLSEVGYLDADAYTIPPTTTSIAEQRTAGTPSPLILERHRGRARGSIVHRLSKPTHFHWAHGSRDTRGNERLHSRNTSA
ncbi:hypothetical protein LTR91_011196 [Friedmanniomyces endolithicus]|uniref:Uncharacterized protein n=1 Tax=Friedmanniomyces endolithicus TaxID=329885 RepID=A0AAN6KIR2_9PEZI|nr:hypothetical protein LTS09_016450 [Friedmanniomyces endolithicus]KAK0813543.1 hypothetical protein LTR75_004638 [Friedmanniomyces endolithicus]KAK0854788.1 hypothetical protein LTR03_002222 [Friedmanniomyces endolithicus]KAK0868644.1 hypothetical protein LTS02_003485 [Friedmanniomyces endolithicus]KAK0879182.1 hypothetical protein LTR87_006997 [Friedmanniomyces endolithicus]